MGHWCSVGKYNLIVFDFLRDPLVQKIASLKDKDLVKYYYHFDECSDAIANSCAEYLLQSNGEGVTFVFDGYDEYSVNLQQNDFVSIILQRKLLPCCHLVVTARPHVSAYLRVNCDWFIQVLGFPKEERQNYIISSLRNRRDSVNELNKYLCNHPIIDSLCFIPFNMTVLLWLYKQKTTLPESATELYEYFICHTIHHYLHKRKITLSKEFKDLDSLEEPYGEVIRELSSLSYKTLEKHQLIFTLDEIKDLCPKVKTLGEINCFGLLQAAQFFGSSNDTQLTFAHLSLQEFLAAYHIRCLPHYKQFCVIKENFMSDFFVDTFTMFVGMTKGENPAFKQCLSGSGKLAARMYGIFGKYVIKIIPHSVATYPFNIRCYFRLHKYFYEAKNRKICEEITKAIHYM